jgi:putative hydrolase of the HAD superfamily
MLLAMETLPFDPSKVKHIVFDLDHTLWDYDTNSAITLRHLFLEYGLEGNVEVFISAFKQANEKVWSMYSEGTIKQAELRPLRFRLLEQKLDWPLGTLPQSFSDDYLLLCPQQPHLYDGVAAMLDYFFGKYPLHILTNGFTETQTKKLKWSGIEGYFQHIVTSETAKAAKPKPAIFLSMMELTEVEPENYLMVGDNPYADVLGARKMGWQAIHYCQGQEKSEVANHSIQNWVEMVRLFS